MICAHIVCILYFLNEVLNRWHNECLQTQVCCIYTLHLLIIITSFLSHPCPFVTPVIAAMEMAKFKLFLLPESQMEVESLLLWRSNRTDSNCTDKCVLRSHFDEQFSRSAEAVTVFRQSQLSYLLVYSSTQNSAWHGVRVQ